MKEKLIEKTNMTNKAILEIHDSSRAIIGDRMLVVLTVRVSIPVASLYDKEKKEDLPPPEELKNLLGDPVVWEHTSERKFIDKLEKQEVFSGLLADFDKNIRHYLMHPAFPVKYILKQFREKTRQSTWYNLS